MFNFLCCEDCEDDGFHEEMILVDTHKYLYGLGLIGKDEKIVADKSKDSKSRINPEKIKIEENTTAFPSEPKNIFSLVWFRLKLLFFGLQFCRHYDAGFHEFYLPRPRVFVLRLKGQPLLEIYLKQVPTNMPLIVIDTEDHPGRNVFEARPISSKRLKKVLRHDESNYSKLSCG